MSSPEVLPQAVGSDRNEPEDSATDVGLMDVDMVVNRLKRAQGQLAGVVRMLEEGRDCEDVVTQIAAVSRALKRAGFAVVTSGLRQCLIDSDGKESLNVQKIEKIFLSLA